MEQRDQQSAGDHQYPIGRGYGHDCMRGGEVFGGYGYSERPEYERRRGEADGRFEAAHRGVRRRGADAMSDDSEAS